MKKDLGVTVRLQPSVHQKLKIYAAKKGTTLSGAISHLLSQGK